MAINSLIEQSGFDAKDQMQRYVRWYREGYMSSNGHCFDIGNTVSAALRRFEVNGNACAGETNLIYGGNGSLMRLSPVPLAYARIPQKAMKYAGESSRTTHGPPEAVDACRYYAGLIVGALAGESKATLLGSHYTPTGKWHSGELSPKIDAIAAGSFKDREPPDIKGTGYVVDALEAALWAFDRSDDFEQGALLAVNLGNDADTTGAIYGQLAGAYYGVEAIPAHWRERLAKAELILDLADELLSLSKFLEKGR